MIVLIAAVVEVLNCIILSYFAVVDFFCWGIIWARVADGSEPAVVALTQHGLEFIVPVISFHCIVGLFMFTIMFIDDWTFCSHLSLVWISCAW